MTVNVSCTASQKHILYFGFEFFVCHLTFLNRKKKKLKYFSTLNVACHFVKLKFELSDRRKTLQKNNKKYLLQQNYNFSKDFIRWNRTLPETYSNFITKSMANPFIFSNIFNDGQKQIVFPKLYAVVRCILKKSFDFVVGFL